MSTSLPKGPPANGPDGPRLYVVFGEDEPTTVPAGEPTNSWHWLEFWEYLRRTRFRSAEPTYVQLLDIAARLFAEAAGNPRLGSINQASTEAFRDLVAKRTWRDRPVGRRTQYRLIRDLQILLDLAAPKTRDRPRAVRDEGLFGTNGLGMPREAPWIERPKLGKPQAKKGWTVDETARILEACKVARQPCGDRSPAWWRALFVWGWNVGTRIGATLKLNWEMLEADEDGGWLVKIPGDIQKTDEPTIAYVNHAAYEAAISIRETDEVRLFPWPFTLQVWHVHRKHIMKASGIPESRYHGNGYHGFRRSLATRISKMAGTEAAQHQLGHSDAATTARHYEHIEVVKAPLERMAQPTDPLEQKRLF